MSVENSTVVSFRSAASGTVQAPGRGSVPGLPAFYKAGFCQKCPGKPKARQIGGIQPAIELGDISYSAGDKYRDINRICNLLSEFDEISAADDRVPVIDLSLIHI